MPRVGATAEQNGGVCHRAPRQGLDREKGLEVCKVWPGGDRGPTCQLITQEQLGATLA